MNKQIAEQAVIGGILIDPSRFQDVADKLTPEDFQNAVNRKIWVTFHDLDRDNEPLDLITVMERVGEGQYLGDLHRNTPSAANVEQYVELVKDASLQRQLLVAGSKVIEIAKGGGKAREKIDKAQSALLAIADSKSESGPKHVSEYLASWMNGIECRINRKGDLIGESTGLSDLDKLTAGLQPTDLIVVAARPSMGKTTLAMNFAENIAIREGLPALVFSLEMSAEQLINRSVCSLGSVDQERMRLADLDESGWAKVTSASGMISKSGLIVDETPGISILELRARAKRVHRKTPLKLIVVDYIQLMSGKGDNQNIIVSDISRGLKALAKELRVPVVALSQLNRSLEQRQDKRPRMSDLRDSGAIEQDADIVMFVYRDEVYNDQTNYKGVAEIIIGKQRNGPIGKVFTSFQGNFCRFKNYIGEIIEQKQTDDRWSGGFGG